MYGWIAFILLSTGIVAISWPSLRQPRSHGFYRFFAWETILGLFLLNLRGWFANPFTWYQIISWIQLFVSLVPITYGVYLLRRAGKPIDALEATTRLVTEGIYHYIRHPLYASLVYLAWGIFFKSPSLFSMPPSAPTRPSAWSSLGRNTQGICARRKY
jgi:hypothetical protein